MKWKFPASSAEDLLHHCQLQLLFKIQMKITRPHFEIMSVTNSWAINNLHYFTILCALWCVIMIVILHHLRRSQSAPWSLKKDNSWRSAATGEKNLWFESLHFSQKIFWWVLENHFPWTSTFIDVAKKSWKYNTNLSCIFDPNGHLHS